MSQSIPASNYTQVNPGVLSAGGNAPSMSGLSLTNSTRVPIGTYQSFASQAAVASYFGGASLEAADAAVYFAGFVNKTKTPGALLFVQYPLTAVPAYLRGGNISGLTLAQLQAVSTSGVLTMTIDGQTITSSAINLSGATSFSNAATIIQTAIGNYDAVVTAAISATTMTVSAVSSGTLAVGQVISGTGVTAGTTITALGTGTGGTGTYTVSVSQTASSTTISAGMTLCSYDSTSGAFVITGGTPGATGSITFATGTASAGLLLTAATGAVVSQGSAIATPVAFMTALVGVTQNFASFATNWEPVDADKVAFASWAAAQNDAYAYVMDNTAIAITTSNSSSTALYTIIQDGYGGTIANYQPTYLHTAAFTMGYIASVNFNVPQGRASAAYKQSPVLAPGVFTQTAANNIEANGANYYGGVANATNGWNFYFPGQITGTFKWVDTYINQIWLNQSLQTSIMTLLTNINSLPYNQAGYDLISAACNDPVQAAIVNGVIQSGVVLSATQVLEVNTAAGANIAPIIQTRGWYLQIGPATPAQRASRGSPPCTLWYTDGGSVNRINLGSIVVQ